MSDLVGNPEDLFSRVAAHITVLHGLVHSFAIFSVKVHINCSKIDKVQQTFCPYFINSKIKSGSYENCMSSAMRKPTFRICENKGADQLQ